MTCENGVSKIVQITVTTLALIVLAVSLHGVMPVFFNMFRTTVRTIHYPIRSVALTDHFEASCVADQV